MSESLDKIVKTNDATAVAEFILKNTPESYDINSALLRASSEGHAHSLASIIASVPQKTLNKKIISSAILQAVSFGHDECVGALIPLSSENDISKALGEAAYLGNLSCVQKLLPKASTSSKMNALSSAAAAGEQQCTLLIAAETDINDNRNRATSALIACVKYGFSDCVRAILPASDAKYGNSIAIQTAAQNGAVECIRILAPYSDTDAAISSLKSRGLEDDANLLSTIRDEMNLLEKLRKTHAAPRSVSLKNSKNAI